MRKVILLEHVSLDGFVAGSNGEMDWITYDAELEKYVHDLTSSEQTSTVDTTIYGRVTYQMMEWYWPTVPANPASTPSEVEYANWLNQATKIVFSTTLEKVEWQNTILLNGNLAEEIAKLKQQPGKDLLMIGSASLAQAFMQLGLIDEYRINVNPVALGNGKPLFAGLDKPLNLKLLAARTFESGVMAFHYETVR